MTRLGLGRRTSPAQRSSSAVNCSKILSACWTSNAPIASDLDGGDGTGREPSSGVIMGHARLHRADRTEWLPDRIVAHGLVGGGPCAEQSGQTDGSGPQRRTRPPRDARPLLGIRCHDRLGVRGTLAGIPGSGARTEPRPSPPVRSCSPLAGAAGTGRRITATRASMRRTSGRADDTPGTSRRPRRTRTADGRRRAGRGSSASRLGPPRSADRRRVGSCTENRGRCCRGPRARTAAASATLDAGPARTVRSTRSRALDRRPAAAAAASMPTVAGAQPCRLNGWRVCPCIWPAAGASTTGVSPTVRPFAALRRCGADVALVAADRVVRPFPARARTARPAPCSSLGCDGPALAG